MGTAKPAADPIASCGPSKPCVDIAVLQLLLASKLQVKVDGNSKSAAIYTATWLARADGRIAITADPPVNGRRNIRILLVEGHETPSDEGDAESAVFNLTIANGTIEETEVVAQMTG